ncbi:ribosomal protein S18-alanine N-acetyltransferase [Stappia sp. ES.058]|uniref:ribosomal protein S18-alanine N-acetyltransferase n=1 Tax=Stappia sp. ES.058 TaxID=1881061 RepID=UPI00087CDC6F|nr:ribosomal protein S18-alanine N-acetyltransferase [Stappia sp. ES.058]SDU46427.1 ribosomal-protein-alanine N-acetyltransferase [Stappia sp. ES.058]
MTFWWFWAPPPVIEEARPEDLAALADLHDRSFAVGWGADELVALARQSGVFILQARRANVMGSQAALGFVIVRKAADEAEILTIAVDPRQRRRGVGAQLMRAAISRLYADRVKALFLEVDAANAAAVTLYRSLGFRTVGTRKGYYQDSDGDGGALVMRIDLA